MCGIAGLISPDVPIEPNLLRRMTDRMVARGPDSSGEWISPDARVGLGHRRLRIIDLTAAGHQPMASACGRYTLTYNGEIYNFEALRAELGAAGKAPAWRGHSDTEVMLALFSAYGIEASLPKLSGMFALAVYDHERGEVVLARDRFGEKPLYFGWTKAGFAFASTLGPIAATPGFDNPVDQQALSCLLARAYIPAPLSIYAGIAKLEPGCAMTIPADARRGDAPHVVRFFDYADQVLAGAADPIDAAREALDALETTLGNAVGRQLVADVPVGCFLSGGIDSSLITALAQRGAARPLKTFTIGFDEAGFDEAVYAGKVAEHLGTDHTTLYVSPSDAQAVIPHLPSIYDEPFADSSQIPTYLVSRLARESVTVSLSGDAGDELFGGYNRHIRMPSTWRRLRKVPAPLRRPALGLGAAIPASAWNRLAQTFRASGSVSFGHAVRRGLGAMAQAHDFDGLLDRFLDDWAGHGSPLADRAVRPIALRTDPRLAGLPLEVQLMHADAMTYLPGDVLAKVDRAGMAVSLESRIPFLDPEVTALAARIAPSLKFAGGGGKDILKQLLYRHVPRALVDRPKAGFAVPVGSWLRSDLREWAEDLLSERALAESGLLDGKVIRARWAAHLAGREDATQPIWSVLMFQAWRRQAASPAR